MFPTTISQISGVVLPKPPISVFLTFQEKQKTVFCSHLFTCIILVKICILRLHTCFCNNIYLRDRCFLAQNHQE